MPYGMTNWIKNFLRDLEAMKLTLRVYKEGEEDKYIPIECQLRILPFGLYEFVFPREHKDLVLTTLDFHKPIAYNLDKEIKILGMKIKPLDYARKFLRLQEAKDFKTDYLIPISRQNVGIVCFGVREEEHPDVTEKQGDLTGWKHEAI